MEGRKTDDWVNENLKRIQNPESNFEKYHLYQGLMDMAVALSDLKKDIKVIKRNVAQIQTVVRRKSFTKGRWTR